MKIKPANIASFAVAAFLLIAVEPLGAKEGALELAGRNYRRGHYIRARHYFREAIDGGLKGEELKFAQYAVSMIDKHRLYLKDIERDESRMRMKLYDSQTADSLSERHLSLAKKLLEGEFYLPIVEPHLKRALSLKPKNVEAYLILANACYASMQYVKAIKNYEKAIELEPKNLYAHKMAGDACVAIGDFDKAKKLYLSLIRVNDESILRYEPSEIEKVKKIMRGLPETYKDIDSLLKDERREEAEEILKKRISLNGADYIALTALGSLYQDRGDRKGALGLFKAAIKVAPDYPIAHLYLGRLHYLMRKTDDAIYELNLFKEKMRGLPKMDDETRKMYISSLHYLCEVYFTLDRYEDFRKEAEEILKLDPNDQGAFYNLGIYHYVYEHNRSRAYASLKRVIELEPNTNIAKSAKYAIEFIRSNPDSRFAPDFSFIEQEYRD